MVQQFETECNGPSPVRSIDSRKTMQRPLFATSGNVGLGRTLRSLADHLCQTGWVKCLQCRWKQALGATWSTTGGCASCECLILRLLRLLWGTILLAFAKNDRKWMKVFLLDVSCRLCCAEKRFSSSSGFCWDRRGRRVWASAVPNQRVKQICLKSGKFDWSVL